MDSSGSLFMSLWLGPLPLWKTLKFLWVLQPDKKERPGLCRPFHHFLPAIPCIQVHFMAMWCKMFNVIFLWPCQSFPLSHVCNLCTSPYELYKTNCANCITCELFFKEFRWIFRESVGTFQNFYFLYFNIYFPISDWPRLTAPLALWASKQKRLLSQN